MARRTSTGPSPKRRREVRWDVYGIAGGEFGRRAQDVTAKGDRRARILFLHVIYEIGPPGRPLLPIATLPFVYHRNLIMPPTSITCVERGKNIFSRRSNGSTFTGGPVTLFRFLCAS
jgi:hypothetical protein